MKFSFKKCLAALTAAVLLSGSAALADTITFTGTVIAGGTHEVYAPIGGTVGSVEVEAGQRVRAGDVLATLTTTKVYASEDGIITGLFGQPGDSAETVAQKYGAVLYIEGKSVYAIAASTDNAYNATENKFVRVGEQVYLSCYSDAGHTGRGVITSIQGTSYNVDVLSGEFLVGETVNIYRGDSATSTQRIGRGELSRTSPTAVTGSGSIVSFAVADGDAVQRGDLLFETLNGSFDGLYMSGNQILAGVDGTVAQLNLNQGGMVEKDSVAAVIYPADAMRIEAQVNESDLASIAEGDRVSIELIWNQDDGILYEGVVSMISAIATESAGNAETVSVTYTVYIDFTPDENTRYGMSAVVSTMDKEQAEEDEEESIDEDEPEDVPMKPGQFPAMGDGEMPARGERPGQGMPGQFPNAGEQDDE